MSHLEGAHEHQREVMRRRVVCARGGTRGGCEGRKNHQEGASQKVTLQWTKIPILTDSQIAITRLQYMIPGLGQWLTRLVIARAHKLAMRELEVEVH